MKVLCLGDLHLGRPASKVAAAHDAQRFSPLAAWDAIVECAINEAVELVLLTGDIVDRDNRYFESIGPLERGLTRLAHADIRTFAVSGNHDFDVLTRVADALPPEHFRLLGRHGRWEEVVVEAQGEPRLRLHGWSFPRQHFERDPLEDYELASDPELPTLGLLHADLDAPGSSYAPVMLASLRQRAVTAWLLGHIHRPMLSTDLAGPAVLYPGSPSALDSGEMGPHGPWLLDVRGPRSIEARQIPLSRIRYEVLQVDLTGVESQAEFEQRLTSEVRQQLAAVAERGGPLELLSLRVRLVGRTALRREIDGLLADLLSDYAPRVDSVAAQIERVFNETRPAYDLAELARAHDAPGTLARMVLELEEGLESPRALRWIAAAQPKLAAVHRSGAFAMIAHDSPPDDETARRMLVAEGLALIDELLAQKESA